MPVTFRRARASDARAVAELVERSYAPWVPVVGLRPAPMDADYPAVVEEQPVWVAVDDRGDRVVGVLVLEIEPDHLQVDNVAVDPGLQGAGIGSRLLEIAEDAARAAQVSEVRLFTHVLMASNIALYKRRGYVEVERRDEDAFSRVFFTKRLGPTGQGRGPAGGSPTGHR